MHVADANERMNEICERRYCSDPSKMIHTKKQVQKIKRLPGTNSSPIISGFAGQTDELSHCNQACYSYGRRYVLVDFKTPFSQGVILLRF